MYTTALNIQFAICIAGEDDDDLEIWKVYRVLPDSKASEVECLRVIDESGEDYLYPQSQFRCGISRRRSREIIGYC